MLCVSVNLTGWCYWPVLLKVGSCSGRSPRHKAAPGNTATATSCCRSFCGGSWSRLATETQLGNLAPPNLSVDMFSCCSCRTSPASFASCSCLEEPPGGSCACYERAGVRGKKTAWPPRLLHCCSAKAFVPVPLPQVGNKARSS